MSRIGLVITALVVVLVSMVGLRAIEERSRRDVGNALQGVLSTAQRGLDHRGAQAQADIERWGTDPRVAELATTLLEIGDDPEALRASGAQVAVRALLGPVVAARAYRGFFLIAPDGLSLASARDANIGILNLLSEQPDFLAQVLSGELRTSRPLWSDVPLDSTGESSVREPTMFAGGPVVGPDGAVLAILTLRLDPAGEFSRLLSFARLGETGETYAFDSEGRMLTASRFEPQLLDLGLLAPDEGSMLSVEIRDPGVNLAAGEPPRETGTRPLTRAVAAAVQGESGMDLMGYRDYRGVPVVGAWRWDADGSFGLATEQDRDEAFTSLKQMRRLTLTTLTAVLLLTLGLLAVQGRATRRALRSADALEASEAKHRVVATAAHDGLVTLDSTGVIQFANAAIGTIFGWSEAELVGEPITRLMSADMAAAHSRAFAQVVRTGKRTRSWSAVEVVGRHRDGHAVPLEVSFGDVVSDGERLFIGVLRDVTERRAAEQDKRALEAELHQAQKLESIGRLAGGVAHDFNNLLMGIMGSLELASSPGIADAERARRLTEARATAERAAELTRRLLGTARLHRTRSEAVDLSALVGQTSSILGSLVGDGIVLTLPVAEDCWVEGDPVELEQVLLNLVSNARDAMAAKGTLLVELERQGADVVLRVIDDGAGMSDEVADHIFEPFYTTKEAGSGTGLGLSIVYRVVQDGGGRIAVRSRLGSGTTIEIHFPGCAPVAPPPPTMQLDSGSFALGGSVLVVDDEPIVLQVVTSALREAGLSVKSAPDGLHAAALLSDGYAPQVLITDLSMPGMDGFDLADLARKLLPDLKVVFTTGFGEDVLERRDLDPADLLLLRKPFRLADVLETVRGLLRP